MYHPCELTTYGKLFFTLVVKTTHVRLDSLAMGSHCNTCIIFFFIYVVNAILENLQKIECANGGKTRLRQQISEGRSKEIVNDRMI